MRRASIAAITFLAVAALPSQPFAADICQATALQDVPAIEGGYILKKGAVDEGITEYLVDKLSGQTSFCSHGGFCYPTYVEENGIKIEALKLDNCTIDKKSASQDPEQIMYDVVPDRAKISKKVLHEDDLDNRLLQLGLCSACADTAAHLYLQKPESRCGILVRGSLDGDQMLYVL